MPEINPDKWLVAIAGFVNDWLYSRQWSRILLYSIPSVLLVLLAGAVFAGGILNRTKLRNEYLQLGQAELQRWQDQLAKPPKAAEPTTDNADSSEKPDLAPTEASEKSSDLESAESNDERKLSPYAEMLFRRAHLLEPSEETQFVIGATMWQRGAIANAQRTLEKIAPKDQKGYPAAHAIMAKICREEIARTRNPALVSEFQHHANIAVEWPKAFPETLLENANLLWQQKKFDDSLKYLSQASKSYPEFYVLLVDRAKSLKQDVFAQSVRKEGIEYYQADLAKNPKSDSSRVQLAQLQLLDPEGDAAAEQLLVEGLQQVPSSKTYARALSEIYRIRFGRKLEQSNGKSVEIALLERALQFDSTNPEIAQVVASLMRSGIQASDQLGAELNRILASGQATMATHAILSEYHLQNERFSEATTHLEQVYKVAPLAVKYANNLAFLYAKEGRHTDAEKVAVQTLSLVKNNGSQREPFVDELFDTLGMIYQAQEKSSDAIASYEASLKLNPLRTPTRERLIVLYRKTGNVGVADAHEKAIQEIEKAKAEQKAAQSTPVTQQDSSKHDEKSASNVETEGQPSKQNE